MIKVRFRDTFRERMPEWITSLAMLIWGLIVLSQGENLWSREFYSVLSTIGTQASWGWLTTIVGALRLVALTINGAWRPTGHIRAFGALVGSVVWSALIIGYMIMDWSPPAIATQSAMLLLDISAIWFAAGDAKVADIFANNKNVRDKAMR